MLKGEILKRLRESTDYVSGQELCDEFSVSRTAVWKAIGKLKDEGYQIDSVTNRGYRLNENPDLLTQSEVESRITTKWLGHTLFCYDEIDSTNTELKRLAEKESGLPHGALAVTDRQVAGRGRRGRVWETPSGTNIAMSFLLRPSFEPDRAHMLTIVAALAVTSATEEMLQGLALDTAGMCQIKWPNDVLLNKKKYCGILTEMSTELDYIHYVIVGIGLNVNNESFPEELPDATSIRLEAGRGICRAELVNAILKYFEEYLELFEKSKDLSLLIDIYNKRLASLDKEVRVLDPKGEFSGISRGINAEGELIVERADGSTAYVYAGEVSVRGIYGYA